jgi:O-antigen/teichoic acid export membrane protein
MSLSASADKLPARRARSRFILAGAASSFAARAIGAATAFLAVPLTISYLGPECYGAWIAITSLLAWLSITDLGLSNGLANAITEATGRNDSALIRTHFANGLLLLSLLAAAGAIATLFIIPAVPWVALFNLTSPSARAEICAAIEAAILIFLAQLPLTIVPKLFLALQQAGIANLWSATANLCALAALLVVTRFHAGLVVLVLAVTGARCIVNLASLVWLLTTRPALRPSLSDLAPGLMPRLLHTGGKFFAIQLIALIVFETDNLLVGHYLGAARIPEYNLTYKLFTYAALPQTLAFFYLWTAYAEAIARRDIAWVRNTFRAACRANLALTAAAALAATLLATPFIRWWTAGAVTPHQPLILWLAAWSLINAITNPSACLLAAASRLTAQILYSAAAALTNIPLSIYLINLWGIQGAIAGTVISYALFICLPIQLDAQRLLASLQPA